MKEGRPVGFGLVESPLKKIEKRLAELTKILERQAKR